MKKMTNPFLSQTAIAKSLSLTFSKIHLSLVFLETKML